LEHFLLGWMVSLTASWLQTISGLVLRVDLESAETPPQPFEGSLPSLWLLFFALAAFVINPGFGDWL